MHIGDNYKSDIINAKINRIETIYFSADKESFLKKYADNTNSVCSNYDEVLGYTYFGALTMGFVTWIYNKCKEENIKTLYFFSREGYFLKKTFDMLYNNEIKTIYLYVSRKSLSVPLLQYTNSFAEVEGIVYTGSPAMTVIRFLSKIGLDDDNIVEKLERQKIYRDMPLKRINDKDLFYNTIKEDMCKLSIKQFENIKKYFNTNIINTDKIGIVDIGWTGGMQKNFVEILRKLGGKQNVVGLFLGQKHEIVKYLKMGLVNYGYLFNYAEKRKCELITSSCGLLEMVFFADHGTTTGYNEEGPVLNAGDIPESTKIHLIFLQEGILKYVKCMSKMNEKYGIISSDLIIDQLKDLFKYPKLQVLDYIGEWDFYDDMEVKIAHRMHFFPLKAFINGFINSAWAVGFLRRNFRIRAPYYELLILLKRLRRFTREIGV